MRYFPIVVVVVAAAVALTVPASFTGMYGLFVWPIRTISCHRAVGCCVVLLS